MKRFRCVVLVLSLPLSPMPGGAAPAELITSETAFGFSGETTAAGSCRVEFVPASGAEGVFSLKMTYRLNEHRKGDWLDCSMVCVPPLDLSRQRSVRLWIRAEQGGIAPWLKMVDADNPPPNHSAFEGEIRPAGKPLAAGEWVAFDVPLPADRVRRDAITTIDFYLPAALERVPVSRDLVFYVGRFLYSPPERPPWPPPAADRTGKIQTVFDGPLSPQDWRVVGAPDNQSQGRARFVDDGVVFTADAEGWNEFLWSMPERIPLAPATTYRLQFDFEVMAPLEGEGAMFYSLVRAANTIRDDVGWQRWTGAPGFRGRRLVTFTTHDKPGYRIIFGVRHQGGIRISGVRVWEVGEEGS